MGEAFISRRGGGSGGGLNFKVICNPQPSTAKENTIWVDTDKINNYYFSATQPDNMVEYDVWFYIGTSSTVAFNALKKNGIEIYPISAKQKLDGVLVDKTVKSYKSGEWVEWVTWIYNKGDQCTDVTGGWSVVSEDNSYWTNGVVEYNDNHIRLYNSTSKRISMTATNDKIDLSKVNEVCINVESLTGSNQAELGLIASTERKSDASFDISFATAVTSVIAPYTGTLILDVSALSGEYYIALNSYTHSGASEAIISEVWME